MVSGGEGEGAFGTITSFYATKLCIIPKGKQLQFSFLRLRALKIGHFCTFNEKWLIVGALRASKGIMAVGKKALL